MHENKQAIPKILNQIKLSGAGYDILRYVCLPDLLGEDTEKILYVMGKNLARSFQLNTIEDIVQFFQQMGWGNLTLIKEKKSELIFELEGEPIIQRLDTNIEHDYRLESGFLAEAIHQLKDAPCECIETIKNRKKCIQLHAIFS